MSVTLAAGVTLIDFLNKSLETLKLVQQEEPEREKITLHLATLTQQLSMTMVEAAQLQGQLAQKNEEIRQLKQKLDEKIQIKYDHKTEVYWAENDPSPYCPKCYEDESKLIHMTFFKGSTSNGYMPSFAPSYNCAVCKGEYKKVNRS
ncbi:hypothetical protein L4D20_02255 [Vibrio kyushuensis]|uniref:hypothetical protein n=1 Tax=Vibrio kyushuensis TaxID=2910249 RepID=UPI003D0FEF16